METKIDVERNVDSFLQIGDFVGASFFFSSLALFLTALFIFFQLRHTPKLWRVPVLIAAFVPLVAALNSFYRRNYWITTMTDPVEFRFFDWFLTVPLMAISFYYLLKPLGQKRGMFFRLLAASLWMLGFGYLGEVLQPERSVMWGTVSMIGFAVIIGLIMGEGYPKIFRLSQGSALRSGYLLLSILLPIGWCIYPVGYMTMPGNLLEGTLDSQFVSVMYNLADVLNKSGLAIGIYVISRESLESQSALVRKVMGNDYDINVPSQENYSPTKKTFPTK